MQEQRKSLMQLKNEAKKLGYGVRKWATIADIPWQSLYRKIKNESTLRLSEYDRLLAAVENMKGKTTHAN